ncbi:MULTISPECIES: hypothetical protein [unclassified Calothrix]|uniref:hypothetical protein n=1 Tax=unclassified Calothrix TaxID=2619626 RepID=UPI0018F005D3|nr:MULTISPECIES: hypothetical protein [unclassified Calothrix]
MSGYMSMFDRLREIHYQQGCRDRDAGLLPQMQGSVYLEAYLQGRPQGLDGIIQYFPSVEAYMQWKFKDLGTSRK